jgi:hypothetical protein
VSNVNGKPKCDADQKRRDETLDVMMKGVSALCAGVDALSRRLDSFDREKAEAEPLAHKYT